MITGGYYEAFETISDASFNDLIKTYHDKQPGLIDDFIKSYVLYNKDNTYNEYLQTYTTSKENLDNQNAAMFATINDLQNNIDELNAQIVQQNKTLGTNLQQNTTTSNKLTNLNGTNKSAKILIENSKELYKLQYIDNISKVIGIIILLLLFYFLIFNTPSSNNLNPTSNT